MKDLVFGVTFIALGALVIILAQDFPSVPGMQYGADLFPTLIAIGMIGAGAVLSFNAFGQIRQGAGGTRLPSGLLRSSLGAMLPAVMVGAYIGLNEILGSALTMLLIMLVLLIQQGVRIVPASAISLTATAVISLAFSHLLKVPLPIGPLGF